MREWEAFAAVEPFGDERADLRNGILATLVARFAGKKDAKPADFMPDFDRQAKPKKAPSAVATAIKGIARAVGSTAPRRESS